MGYVNLHVRSRSKEVVVRAVGACFDMDPAALKLKMTFLIQAVVVPVVASQVQLDEHTCRSRLAHPRTKFIFLKPMQKQANSRSLTQNRSLFGA